MQALLLMVFSIAIALVGVSAEAQTSNVPAAATPALEALPSALTFQAWKNLRVDEARLVLERLTFENQIQRSPGVRTMGSRVEQAKMNLEIAQELTVNDYLAIYLSRFKSRDVIVDVARRMSAEEIADLLMSHQRLAPSGAMAENSSVPTPRLSPRPL